METKNGNVAVPTVANWSSLVLCTKGMRSVLQNIKSKFARQPPYFSHITALPSKVNRNHHFGQRQISDCALQLFCKLFHAHVQGIRIDVHKIDICSTIEGAVRTSDECN